MLVKLSCHDSGIDIRDPPPPPLPVVQPSKKTVYSDADILLSDDFAPPVTIHPLLPDGDDVLERRKKTSSVSFSLDDSKEGDEEVVPLREKKDEDDRQESKKNKVR